jgi:hypothetical protein
VDEGEVERPCNRRVIDLGKDLLMSRGWVSRTDSHEKEKAP